MNSAIDQFNVSITRVRALMAIYQFLEAQSTSALDLSDILRASLVLAVSALDYYVHEIVRIRMLEIHSGIRQEPNPPNNSTQSAFSKFKVSLGNASEDRQLILNSASWILDDLTQIYGNDFINTPQDISQIVSAISNRIDIKLNNTAWLENEIRERHSYLSFQQPDKIADAVKLISSKKLWKEVANIMGKTDQEIKQQLSLIVDRRNKIAHEADINPTYNLGERWNIDENQVNEAINFLENLVKAIDSILT
ncbi:HEPN domain-containing protein [Cyanobacterium aponinum]|uniref:RiboL-PSP-HEPN domain-containing protein n=1 Tax=Cyanobacterium aponinum 0216 TaxID=2676140 RepID=A0A844GZ16_9CHRO|nr:HEPN domain-containing protein [Cyanobacterium aponinum]MTF40059.1 hypothetical protein [Cyanobacterium aponinum 0216]